MNSFEPDSPAPPPDDEFSRLLTNALNDGDYSLTDRRRAEVLRAFGDAAQGDGGTRKQRVIPVAWWLAAGAAAACVVLWLSGPFSGPTEVAKDRGTAPVIHETAAAGEQLALANLRLAVLNDQLSRAEHQLLWLQATEKKRQ
jgi:hypothetical protein